MFKVVVMANGKKLVRNNSSVVQHLAIHNYSTFEAHYLQRLHYDKRKTDNNSCQYQFCSGFESDIGSNGLAVKDFGSKRSDGWIRPTAQKNRSVKRCISTDSGFSSTKTDSGSSSDFSYSNGIRSSRRAGECEVFSKG